VCSSPHRLQIEKLVVASYGYSAVLHQLPEDHGLTARNIGDHVHNGHLPMAAPSVTAFIEEPTRERDNVADAATDVVEQAFGLVQTVLGRTFEKLKNGSIDPTLKEGLAAAKLVFEFEALAQQRVDQEAVFKAFVVYCQQAREVMTKDQLLEFGRRLQSNPTLRNLQEATGSRFD
jgi:hypothetical protein